MPMQLRLMLQKLLRNRSRPLPRTQRDDRRAHMKTHVGFFPARRPEEPDVRAPSSPQGVVRPSHAIPCCAPAGGGLLSGSRGWELPRLGEVGCLFPLRRRQEAVRLRVRDRVVPAGCDDGPCEDARGERGEPQGRNGAVAQMALDRWQFSDYFMLP